MKAYLLWHDVLKFIGIFKTKKEALAELENNSLKDDIRLIEVEDLFKNE